MYSILWKASRCSGSRSAGCARTSPPRAILILVHIGDYHQGLAWLAIKAWSHVENSELLASGLMPLAELLDGYAASAGRVIDHQTLFFLSGARFLSMHRDLPWDVFARGPRSAPSSGCAIELARRWTSGVLYPATGEVFLTKSSF